jgi:hypothetical protein
LGPVAPVSYRACKSSRQAFENAFASPKPTRPRAGHGQSCQTLSNRPACRTSDHAKSSTQRLLQHSRNIVRRRPHSGQSAWMIRSAHRTQNRRFPAVSDGARRTRTADLLGAIQALSQLSYSPGRRKCSGAPGDSASGRDGRACVASRFTEACIPRDEHELGVADPDRRRELDGVSGPQRLQLTQLTGQSGERRFKLDDP